MAQKIQAIKGVNDVFPPEIHHWHRIEAAARRVLGAHGYDEIRIPIIEKTELFTRSIGEVTDVVEKEMYSFLDKGGDPVTLRPEGTAGVVRAYVEHGIAVSDPAARFWYLGPMFRYERPQKGRYRQFWQLGAELFGQVSPRVDAEMLGMLRALLDDVGIRGVVMQVTSLGDAQCRPPYKADLQTFLRGVSTMPPLRAEARANVGGKPTKLCEDCVRRIETNPLRVLDCKKESCREATASAPLLLDRLCEPCAQHWAETRRNLDLLGVAVEVNPRIVRGLDYYVRTSFELVHRAEGPEAALGSQNAVGGGGRYDGLVKELGGPPQAPGIGFGLGMERLVLVLQQQEGEAKRPAMVFLAALGPTAADRAMVLAAGLRRAGLRTELAYDAKHKALGNVLEKADRRGARVAIILGDEELARGVAKVKDLRSGEQSELPLGDVEALASALKVLLERS